jgi:hypothetical protein
VSNASRHGPGNAKRLVDDAGRFFFSGACGGTTQIGARWLNKEGSHHMVEKFNPAPLDKHPEDPKEAAKADREMDGNFMAGLVGTFPASDPVSATQPGTRTGSPNPLWIR